MTFYKETYHTGGAGFWFCPDDKVKLEIYKLDLYLDYFFNDTNRWRIQL